MLEKEGKLIGNHILACSPQVGKIAARAKAGKLILTHIREKPDSLMAEVIAKVKADYNGEIIAGKDLMEIRV